MRVILIVSDTFRYDHLGINGNEEIITPELDEFGEDAVVFDNCYVSSFPTIPHRCDLNTGRWGFPFHGWQPLERDETPLAEHMREAGYHTQLIADCPHLMSGAHNFWRGFEGYYWNRGQEGDTYLLRLNDPPECRVPVSKTRQSSICGFDVGLEDIAHWTNREWAWEGDTFAASTSQVACKWMEQNYRCEDFFLWVDFFDAHEPWDAPQHFAELYDPGFTCQRMMHPNYGHASAYTDEELRNLQANYAGEITLVSKWIGQLLRKIKDCGIYDDTFIVFTSDHGMYLGEHDRTGKTNINDEDERGPWPMYEEIVHIPLMIKPPKSCEGIRRSEVVQPPDIGATLLDAAGIAQPDEIIGQSLMPLLEGEGNSGWQRSSAVCGQGFHENMDILPPQTVTDGHWSLQFGAGRAPELYDLDEDPAQQNNIAADNPGKIRELHSAVTDLLKREGADADRIELVEDALN
ncbi:MAG: sulfatase [Candidatus Brocadiia bacterium]